MLRRVLVVLVLLMLLLGLLSYSYGTRSISDGVVAMATGLLEPTAPPTGQAIAFSVESGEGGAQIAEKLVRTGLIRNPTLFRFLLSYYGVAGALKVGHYELPSGIGPRDIITILTNGQVDLVSITVPEGWRAEEIADLVEAKGVARRDEFLSLVRAGNADQTLSSVALPIGSLEGYLFPDTYLVRRDFGAKAFLQLMLQTFDERFSKEMRQEAQARGLTVQQVVTLASIVEREAALAQEQPLIAGVLLYRLEDGQPLAADPTIQYALVAYGGKLPGGGYWKRELTVDDLKLASPYNTYQTAGLPPGPIANPGLGALKAVLHPQESNYRYFVAKPDGSHAFSTTFEEHLHNVALYQR